MMPFMTIPASIDAIRPEWLTETLRGSGALRDANVTGIEFTNIGEGTGIFGQISRLGLDYDRPGAGPASVVAKMPCLEPENLAVAHALGIYEREIRFFEQVAPTTQLRIPACHLATLTNDGHFVLILEDLSSAYDVRDQVVGATLDQAHGVIDALVGLHARWWETPQLHALDWLPVPDSPGYLAAVPGIYRAGLPVLRESWADRLPAASLDLAERLDPRFEELMVMTGGTPQTFAHSDTRLDNLFFEKNGDGVAFIDFQLSLRGRGVTDLAYFIGTSVQGDIAANNWESLLKRWHDQLTDAGVDYSWDDAVVHYKQCALFYLCGAMSLIGTFDSGNERGAALTEAYTARIFNHVVDAETASVLD